MGTKPPDENLVNYLNFSFWKKPVEAFFLGGGDF